jgi:hypothetical protein
MTPPCMSISSIAGARPFGMWSHPWDSNRRPADYELAGTPLNDRAGGESLAIEISPAPWPSSGAKYLSSIAAFVPWPNISPNLRTIFRWKGEVGASSSNPLCSTFQSPRFRRCQRIDQDRRVCARSTIVGGPGEHLFRRDSPELANSSLGAICLGPRIIAIDSPEDDFALSRYSIDLCSIRAEHSRNRGARPGGSSRPIAYVTRVPMLTRGGVVPISARNTVSASTDSA